ncbi:conserved hypothetical protein [Sporisorium reilianum SRZ2]|uniref:Uncharacterized protein n=1 Tax=Sporisorium reilianum (strain SRZ2) TaxID=999809 RepID=E6ZJX4_SPORE|nr:conserved hypothetical protein [Sporisorium reilianum SRZ2]
MSLRPDSVYRVELSNHAEPDEAKDARSPPKVVQIRLTEQALQQLANAYSSNNGSSTNISIDVDPTDPVLVIGDARFALHAPLPASGPLSSKTTSAADAASTPTAPHELYKLSKDESTLHRIGTIATKLSVKPTRDVSAVAQRLKQQKEEEEHRKEERRRALMQGASPHPTASSSSRTGINKNLAGVRASSVSSSLLTSPLSRSSSLNRISSRREPNLLQSTALSRGISREPSPGSGPTSHGAAHSKPQGVSHDAFANARRADRAFTDSPKLASTTPSRSSDHALDSDHNAGSSGPSRFHHKPATAGEADDRFHDQDRAVQTAQLSSPASAASDVSKKSTKLTTRQRLAKATKAGSRLLAASERRATPERRTVPLATQASPPSKLGSSAKPSLAEGSGIDATAPTHQISPPRLKTKEAATDAGSRPSASGRSERLSSEAHHGSEGTERGRSTSLTSISSTKIVRDGSSASLSRSFEVTDPQKARKAEQDGTSSSAATKASGVASREERSNASSRERTVSAKAEDKRSAASDSKTSSMKLKPKEAPAATVQVVTMKKARQSTSTTEAKPQSSQVSSSSKAPRKSAAESSESDLPPRIDTRKREHGSSDHGTKSVLSSASTKQATTRKSEDDPSDATQRKRRRTNDFVSSDPAPPRREARPSTCSDSNAPRADEGSARPREPSRDRPVRPVETASPLDGQTRASIPVSASMPSFTSSSKRLQTVAEMTEREPRRPKAEAYHDRRRDRSYDEPHHDEYAAYDRDSSSNRDTDRTEARRGRQDAEDARITCCLPPSSSPSTKASAVERPTRGVGPGATHWSEPWLDVRSKADWHRLAQRFTKTQEEYLVSRQRLEAESERLERELELAAKEEQATAQPHGLDAEVPAERSLLFSPHKVSVSAGPRNDEDDHTDPVMGDVEMETAINTSINSRTRAGARTKPAEDDGNDSPEEGEMRSSDDEDDGSARPADAGDSDKRSPETASSLDSLLLASRRSESPDNLVWRSSSAGSPTDGADRPLSYADLADRVKQLNELHGSLSRMHRVLSDFKAKGAVASVR